jgi:hypothetical protein
MRTLVPCVAVGMAAGCLLDGWVSGAAGALIGLCVGTMWVHR